MGKIVRIAINPNVLRWARESLGLSIKIAAKRIGIDEQELARWENGDPVLLGKLKKASEVYKRPTAIFFLSQVPEDAKPIPDFRRLPESMGNPLSPAARLQIRKTYSRQRAAMELGGFRNTWSVAGSLSLKENPEDAAARVRGFLKLNGTEWNSEYDAFNERRRAVETSGVLVFLVSGVSPGEIRGFSINSPAYPIISLNRADRPKARSFTLIHEFCHLALGQSGLCDINDTNYKNSSDSLRIEQFCNHVAGASLVPSDGLLKHPIVRDQPSPNWQQYQLTSLSNVFMVSHEVVLRRLLILGKTNSSFYEQWREDFGGKIDKPRGAPREKAFQKALRTQGESYVRLILGALHNNSITLTRASDYLDLKVPQIFALESALDSRKL